METDIQPAKKSASNVAQCFHCGTPCAGTDWVKAEKSFCCHGCLTVFELLSESGLSDFYNMSDNAGVRVKADANASRFCFLDEPSVRQRIVDFTNADVTRVTFRIPAIHCIACVWLLENLFHLRDGIGVSQVNFPRKEVSLSFQPDRVKLSEVVSLLASLGYEPDLKLSDLETRNRNPISRRLWIQLGVAGFAFGNIMLLSISQYLGLDALSEPGFKKMSGYISFALALPVFFYSSLDYWKSAWISLRRKLLTIEVPIAAGIVALFGQSVFEVWTGRGDGYFDSLCGLLFFLLGGKLFQQKTYDRLSFDRDFKSFFPISVTRKTDREEQVSLSQLQVGDRLAVRNGELIPADSTLRFGSAFIDYSFVTGESELVEKKAGEHLYAGGRQIGGQIEVQTVKAVSQSYLTSLWNQDAFRKEKPETINTITNVYSYRFTKLIFAIALGAALFWWFADDAKSIKAFTSVLIVACPCALALAAPYSLGTAQRVLDRNNIFLKNPTVLETLAKVDAIIFDKTGTLTATGAGSITFSGNALGADEQQWIGSLAKQSVHPSSVRIAEALDHIAALHVRSFSEKPGCGIEGIVGGHEVWLGSTAWLASCGVDVPAKGIASTVDVAVDGNYRGRFELTSGLRPEINQMIDALRPQYELALLSGDNKGQQKAFSTLFAREDAIHFEQSPQNKYSYVSERRDAGNVVMMVGDGLNDAGALKQSDVGVAVVENLSAFSPSSDIIMSAGMLPQLHKVLQYSRASVRIVRLSFLISTVYNIVGIAIAASGNLSPIVCAILMPLSSISVVAFSCGAASYMGRRILGSQENHKDTRNRFEPVPGISQLPPEAMEAA